MRKLAVSALFVVSVILSALVLMPHPVRAEAGTLVPDEATFVLLGVPNGNFDGEVDLEVISAFGADGRSLIRYNFSFADVVVKSATLRWYVATMSGGVTQKVFLIRQVTSAWDETTVTWNTKPTAQSFGQTSYSRDWTDPDPDYIDFNVLPIVRNWTRDEANHGFEFRFEVEGTPPATQLFGYSDDAGVLGNPPELILSWYTDPVPIAIGVFWVALFIVIIAVIIYGAMKVRDFKGGA